MTSGMGLDGTAVVGCFFVLVSAVSVLIADAIFGLGPNFWRWAAIVGASSFAGVLVGRWASDR